MTKGAVVSIALASVAIGAMLMAFLKNASPYVTIAQARTTAGDNLHVVGEMDKSSLASDVRAGEVRFTMKDEEGETVAVVYHGPPPANLGEATKVVVVGGMKDGDFHARQLLLKCPSKYEGTGS
jgi:cytochrome c-type biogenesis protein CcmE